MKRSNPGEWLAIAVAVILLIGGITYYYQLHKRCSEEGGLVLRGTIKLMCVKDGKEI